MPTLFDDRTLAILDRQRGLLHRLADALEAARLGEDARRTREAAEGLSETFLVVVVGEFNSGKSSLINALFETELMEVGPIPTTAKITVLRHGDETFERQLSAFLTERRRPEDLLRYVTLVDTPGTNSIIKEHQRLTEDFVPRADLVLFVTSYDRPLADSERTFLHYIRSDWGKHFVGVINKVDLADSEKDLRQVVEHVATGIEEALGFRPTLFSTSARLATIPDAPEWKTSGFERFRDFVRVTLTGPEQLAIKLASPLDVTEARLRRLDEAVSERTGAIRQDEDRLENLIGRLDATNDHLDEIAARTRREVDALLEDVDERGVSYLDSAFRASNINLLRDKDRFREEFARQVVRDLDKRIETQVTQGVDRMHQRAMQLWQEIVLEIQAGDSPGSGLNREAALRAVEHEAGKLLARHDVREEARAILENASGRTDLVRMTGIGAVGLGALSGVLVVTTTLDVLGGFGIATAGALGLASFGILPRARRQAKEVWRTRLSALRKDLGAALGTELQHQGEELSGRASRLVDSFATAVREERSEVNRALAVREEVSSELVALRKEIGP